jgi:hypothetical protein
MIHGDRAMLAEATPRREATRLAEVQSQRVAVQF